MKTIKILYFILLLSLFSFAQESRQPISDKAVVFIYAKNGPKTVGKLRPMVFMDKVELAKLPPEKYFIVITEPGKRSFHFEKSKKAGGVELNLEAGKIYYLRVGWKVNFFVRPDEIDPVPVEVANFDLKEIKPISKDLIKNKEIVFTEIPK